MLQDVQAQHELMLHHVQEGQGGVTRVRLRARSEEEEWCRGKYGQ